MGWTEGFVYLLTIACLSVSQAPAKEHLLKWSLKLRSGCKMCVRVYERVWFGLRLLIWSWHYGVKLVFFFLLLCLASCSHHLAPGFENQAKSLPPEWHENIPTYTQPSCRSLSSQPQTTSADNRVGGLNGIQRNLLDQWRHKMLLVRVRKCTWKYIEVNLFCGRFTSRNHRCNYEMPNVVFIQVKTLQSAGRCREWAQLNESGWRKRQAEWRGEWLQSSSDLFV